MKFKLNMQIKLKTNKIFCYLGMNENQNEQKLNEQSQ